MAQLFSCALSDESGCMLMVRLNSENGLRLVRVVLALVTALTPFVVSWCYVVLFHQATFFDHVPILSDSIDYWHEIKSFISVGFDFGYYGYEELRAPIGRFGPHGPWYPMLLGVIGKVFGFSLYSIPFFQSVLFSICILGYMVLVKPSLPKVFFLFCFTLTYPAFFFWTPFSMQESLNLAMGVLLAGCFVVLYRRYVAREISSQVFVSIFLVVLFATLIRFTWVLFFAPLLLVRARLTVRGLVGFILLYGLLFVAVQLGSVTLVQAKFPYFESGIAKALRGDYIVFLDRMRYNFSSLFLDLQHGFMAWMFILRYQVLFFIPFVLLLTPRTGSGGLGSEGVNPYVAKVLRLSPAILLSLTIAMLFLFYLCNDIFVYKHVVPVFVFAVFFSVLFVPTHWMWILVLVNILSLPSALGFGNVAHIGSFDRSGVIRKATLDFSRQVEPYMVYSPGDSPWCNTVIVTDYPAELLGIPPGIAFSFIRNYSEYDGRLRSLYLLAPPGADMSGLEGKADLEKLVNTAAGVLYRNRYADCPRKLTGQSDER